MAGETETEPDVPTEPEDVSVQPVALVVVQERVDDSPDSMDVGLAVKLTANSSDGAGAGHRHTPPGWSLQYKVLTPSPRQAPSSGSLSSCVPYFEAATGV